MFATVNGVQLWYEVAGAGRPCLVPSSAGSEFYRRSFSARLHAQLQFIFVDVRGTGRSEPLPADHITPEFLLDDLDQFRRHLGLGPVPMLGHSRHGYFPLAFARSYPERLSHAILIGTLPSYTPATMQRTLAYWKAAAPAERKELVQQNLARLPQVERATPTTAEGFIAWYRAMGPFFWYDPHFDTASLWAGTHLNMTGFNRVYELIQANDLTASLLQVTCPVLLVLGRHDYSAPPALWEGTWQQLPDCTLAVFERSGHGPMFEEPERFDDVLLDWLQSH